jgi:thiopeptide-type bacteriocin biosynthesis protein
MTKHDTSAAAIEQLYSDIERSITGFFSSDYGKNFFGELNVGYIVEQADAAIHRAITESAEGERWLYFRLAMEDAGHDKIISHEIAPLMQGLKSVSLINGWWWLYKRDPHGLAARLRIAMPEPAFREVEIAVAARCGRLGRSYRVLQYEPELRLFGGSRGMKAAHQHFCEDSAFLAAWARQDGSPSLPIIPEGLSLALTIRLLRAAGLDLFECWDVFDRVCDKRRLGNLDDSRLAGYRTLAAKVAQAAPEQIFQLYSGTEQAKLIKDYVSFLDNFGHGLAGIYYEGQLECGLREFLVPIILFHWNRVGLKPFGQFGLSHSIAYEFARLTRKGTAGN